MQEESGPLPSRDDFSGWYNEILWRAEVLDVRYPVKGLYVWYPYGFAIRRAVFDQLRRLMDRDHQEALFPLLIPSQEFMKEAEHIKGFEDEVYWVTHGGRSELDVHLALRPTSETAIYPMYALWIRSHADLPLRIYQVVNTFRYETKHTRPLIRVREITSFKEAHTVHATWEEAEEQVSRAVALYREFYESLCIPVIVSRRPDWDKFPGADYTIAIDTIMPDGRTLQIGTVHHLGDHFSRTFQITYEDPQGEQQFAHQTCYGISERSIAALLSIHGDNNGLILPSSVAPVQVVIVPILMGKRREEVSAAAQTVESELSRAGLRVKVDTREMRPGAKYYHWEMRGVPLRLEIGPRDIDAGAVTAVTRFGERSQIQQARLCEGVMDLLAHIRDEIWNRAACHLENHIATAETLPEAIEAVKNGVVMIHWCGSTECAELAEEKVEAGILGVASFCSTLAETRGPCLMCGKPGTPAMIARPY
jgi:prolyl-tRNA synthetase